jgi:hypothetical protein
MNGVEEAISLTPIEALRAMQLFLRQFYDRAGNDMETLIADISIERDGGTLDPAAWEDWMRCITEVRGSS